MEVGSFNSKPFQNEPELINIKPEISCVKDEEMDITDNYSDESNDPLGINTDFKIETVDASVQEASTTSGFKCNICEKTFTSERNVIIHNSVVHVHECPRCCKQFDNKPMLTEHITIHSADVMACYCYLCKKVFNQKRSLQRHIKVSSNHKVTLLHIAFMES